jgi:hypothetical protein
VRDPIPNDKPRLLVLIESQFALLSSLMPVKPKATQPVMVEDFTQLDVPRLRSLAYTNALKILDLILTSRSTGSF